MSCTAGHGGDPDQTRPNQANKRSMSALLIVQIIRLYRLVPRTQQRCIYHPTCSAYGREAVQVHGAAKGSWLTLRRICRCHPWGQGGIDKVPSSHDNVDTDEHPGTVRRLVGVEE